MKSVAVVARPVTVATAAVVVVVVVVAAMAVRLFAAARALRLGDDSLLLRPAD
jgi:hypothetical protein